jgi:hypothetical protein
MVKTKACERSGETAKKRPLPGAANRATRPLPSQPVSPAFFVFGKGDVNGRQPERRLNEGAIVEAQTRGDSTVVKWRQSLDIAKHRVCRAKTNDD